jgi:2-oxoglutarate dehydrogenase E2 component (dihydrolipoamide succinyltransferase)
MVTEVLAPKATTARTKSSIGRWFKRAGDPVTLDEPLVDIDTGNLIHEVRAPATGVLSTILARDGESVEPGTVLGNISQF